MEQVRPPLLEAGVLPLILLGADSPRDFLLAFHFLQALLVCHLLLPSHDIPVVRIILLQLKN